MYEVSLHLPDLAEPADYPVEPPSPVNAVEEFLAAVQGSGENFVYRVSKGYQHWLVDMAGGPSIKEYEPTKQQVVEAMDVLKAAGCVIDTKQSILNPHEIVFVVYVPLNKMEDV